VTDNGLRSPFCAIAMRIASSGRTRFVVAAGRVSATPTLFKDAASFVVSP
jgi:hypothetical protein